MSRFLSVSRLSSYLRCRQAWYYRYVMKISRRYDRPLLSRGSAVHRGVANGILGLSIEGGIAEWHKEMLEKKLYWEEIEQLEEIRDTSFVIANRAVNDLDIGHRWDTHKVDGVPMVEWRGEVELDLPGWSGVHGFLDWVAIDLKDGSKWLTDHKVRESFMADETEDYNLQMAVYQKVLRKYGIHAAGSISHQIRAAVPKVPELLKAKQKKGVDQPRKMSKAAIVTDWETYSKALDDHNIKHEGYDDMKQKIADVEWARFSRAYWPEATVDRIWDSVVVTGAREMAAMYETNKDWQQFRNIGFMNCKGCNFNELCWGDLRGHDVDDILANQYVVGEQKTYTTMPIIEE